MLGVPIIAGIYGTNPAGGGYQGISPTVLIAHKDANIAVGGGGIVSGMTSRGVYGGAIQPHPVQAAYSGEREHLFRRNVNT